MTTRPRVIAEYANEAETSRSFAGDVFWTAPAVSVRVEFDLHDHAGALALLESAVDYVRAQIEETARD